MYAGIDPGKKGAIVVINDDGLIVHQWVIPLKDGEVDVTAICNMINSLTALKVKHVVLEEPNVLFGVNKTSMYKMGRVIGNLESSLACIGPDYSLVRPKAWQKVIWTTQDVIHKDPKGTSLNSARRLFPGYEQWYYGDNETNNGRRTKIHDGIVDAALLAKYCQLINK